MSKTKSLLALLDVGVAVLASVADAIAKKKRKKKRK